MSWMRKWLGMWVIGKTISSTTPLVMQLILGVVVVALLAIFSSTLLAVLVASSAWFSYAQLITAGWSASASFALVASGLLFLFLTSILVLQHYWHKAYAISRRLAYLQTPFSTRISMMADAFMDGYHSKK